MEVDASVSTLIAVEEASAVGEARRHVQRLAGQLRFSTTDAGRAALVVVELATNIVKHAKRGALVFRPLQAGNRRGIEILALDNGPGMRNVAECLRDGYSTAGSPGTGLGAVSRLTDVFDVYSGSEVGTAVLARLFESPKEAAAVEQIRVGAVCLPVRGEARPGDSWAVEEGHSPAYLVVADGLGHGPAAAKAAEAAIGTFRHKRHDDPPEAILAQAHAALRATRGAAVAVASIDFDKRVVRYAGAGNIAARVIDPGSAESRSMVSQNGTVGVEMRRVQEFSYPWPPGATLVVHSDGLGTRWDLSRYPGLLGRDPALIAGVLYRDYQRGSDDVTVVAVREAATQR